MRNLLNRMLYLGRPLWLVPVAILWSSCATTVTPDRGDSVSSNIVHVPVSGDKPTDPRAEQLFVRGMTQAFLGDYRGALDLYEQVLRIKPDEPAVLSALAEAYEGLNDLATAVFYAERATEFAPDNLHFRQQLASLHLRAGDPNTAAETYRTLVEHFPDNHTALYELARLLATTGKQQEALDVYERLIQLVGDDIDIYREMLQLYADLEDKNGAEKTLKALIELDPTDSNYLILLGDLYRQQKRMDEAAGAYSQALKLNPDDYDILRSLAEVYRGMGREGSADSLLATFEHTESLTTEQLVGRAAALIHNAPNSPREKRQAKEMLENALVRDGNNQDALRMLGELHYQDEAYREAAELFYRLLQQNPREITLWNRTVSAFLESGADERAAEAATEALLLFPGQVDLLRGAGFAYMHLYQNERAIEYLEEAARYLQEESPLDSLLLSDTFSSLALLYWREGEHHTSDSLYEKALTFYENDPYTLNNYAYSLADRKIELQKALHLAERALEIEPDNPSILDTVGWIYFNMGDLPRALERIERAVEKGGTSASIFEHLGDIYYQTGNRNKAREHWEQALNKNPANQRLREKLEP
jgi:tetratricopeptide (TPR) repeat protein